VALGSSVDLSQQLVFCPEAAPHSQPPRIAGTTQIEPRAGTLKLLYEDIIATIKQEGKEIMTFGFSPFFNLQTKPFEGPLWSELSLRFLFNFGNNLYQFKNLAFSKARCVWLGRFVGAN